ncbi:rhodanese-like domain-containing protein, partial [Acidovorax sp. CCYZU-2555]|uniref:rhodanese-like domain-containing protein n=1 Tax=Acidovorax sp. CCYZU-2555 TaxID=2835042 RepID=UPI0020C16F21
MSSPFFSSVPATTLRAWLNDGAEIALLDVREAGQFGEGHPFFAIPAAYSQLENDVPRLVPRRDTRVVLLDAGDGVAERAAHRLTALNYTHLHVLEGGAPAWAAAGYVLFQGVNLPSKTFGELVEHAFDTPRLSAQELQRRQQAGEPLVLLDGRTLGEHRKMTIPGATPVPNGELALRWHALAPDPHTPIVVHCAGRTRSIIGAQILRSLGIPNPVIALENGTQGWALAGQQLEHGSTRRDPTSGTPRPQDQAAAAALADELGVPKLSAAQAQAWIDDSTRTT